MTKANRDDPVMPAVGHWREPVCSYRTPKKPLMLKLPNRL